MFDFKIGDEVNVLPYDEADYHMLIDKTTWDYFVSTSPHRIALVEGRDVMLNDLWFPRETVQKA